MEFSADLYILKPKNPSRGNGLMLFEVVNRSNKRLLGAFSLAAPRATDPTTEADFGDGYLMREGYTLVAVGWQFDVSEGKGLVGFEVPVATENGRPITGWVRSWFILLDAFAPAVEFSVAGYNTRAYTTIDLNNPNYRLTEREGFIIAPRLVPREDWQFARVDNGKPVADPNWVWLKGGFKPGQTYELEYEAKDPPIGGLGFASIRDLASELKYNRDAFALRRYAYTYSKSRTGRFQRHLLYEGFTTNERGRLSIDAMFIQTGGASLGSFNECFAQPNKVGSFTQTKFPILYQTTTDPMIGRKDGLGARVPAGLEPKLVLMDTSSEYWDRGRLAALRHVSIDGCEDVPEPPNVRTCSRGANATRPRNVSASRQRRSAQREHQSTIGGRCGDSWRGSTSGSELRCDAPAIPASEAVGRESDSEERDQVSGGPGRSMALQRPRRLSRRLARAGFCAAVPGAAGRHRRQR